jgi:cytidylate kinase
MKIDISKYLRDRYEAEKSAPKFAGPVITISRECGCPGKRLALTLAEKLNSLDHKFEKNIPWKWISKEILQESAKELGVDQSEIQYVFDYVSHGVLEDLLLSHSRKFYKSDRKIRNTIAKVIRGYAEEGNKIIVGRGGVAITKDIPKSLHIFLEAPLEWRALRISEKDDISIEQAKKYCIDIDKKRKQYVDFYHGIGTDYSRYDLSINSMSFDVNELSEIIISTLKIRKII